MVSTGGIEPASPHRGSFVSTHFMVPKSDGRWRLVFNLKALNQFVHAAHFKMETLAVLPDLAQHGWWMTKLDLKDAFHTVAVHRHRRKFLQFQWRHRRWQYTCLPFGLSESPRVFTKVLRPVAAWFRSMGMILVVYLDDWLLLARSAAQAADQIRIVVTTLEQLGFQVNRTKSVLTPQQVMPFLGVEVDLLSMLLRLPADKLNKIRAECRRVSRKGWMSIAELRSLTGKMVAARLAIHLAMLHVRGLQFLLNTGLARISIGGSTAPYTTTLCRYTKRRHQSR